MKKIIVIGFVLGLLAIFGVSYTLTRSPSDTISSPTSSTVPASTNDSSVAPANAENTITYTDNGFSPNTLTVKAGSKVTIKNSSSNLLQFDSDPHPQHTDDLELNAELIAPGKSKTITVTQTGRHGYHNHLNANDTGILIVD